MKLLIVFLEVKLSGASRIKRDPARSRASARASFSVAERGLEPPRDFFPRSFRDGEQAPLGPDAT